MRKTPEKLLQSEDLLVFFGYGPPNTQILGLSSGDNDSGVEAINDDIELLHQCEKKSKAESVFD